MVNREQKKKKYKWAGGRKLESGLLFQCVGAVILYTSVCMYVYNDKMTLMWRYMAVKRLAVVDGGGGANIKLLFSRPKKDSFNYRPIFRFNLFSTGSFFSSFSFFPSSLRTYRSAFSTTTATPPTASFRYVSFTLTARARARVCCVSYV